MAKRKPSLFKVTRDGLAVIFSQRLEGDKTGKELRFDPQAYSLELRDSLMHWGLRVLMQQRTSDLKGVEAKMLGMTELHQRLMAGEWEAEREGGAPTMAVEVELIMELKSLDAKTARASWKAACEKDAGFADRFRAKHKERLEALREARKEVAEVALDDLG